MSHKSIFKMPSLFVVFHYLSSGLQEKLDNFSTSSKGLGLVLVATSYTHAVSKGPTLELYFVVSHTIIIFFVVSCTTGVSHPFPVVTCNIVFVSTESQSSIKETHSVLSL